MGAASVAWGKPAHGGLAGAPLDCRKKLLETVAFAMGFPYHTRQVQNKP